MRVLMVEDEKFLAEAVAHILKKNGYQVDLAFDGETGLEYASDDIFDVIILDIMLPKLDGISVLKRLREKKISTPIIILSARGETEDKVAGLDHGADDYLAKPFKTAELLARIRALDRRKGKAVTDNILNFSDIKLDKDIHVLSRNDRSFQLTNKEFLLIEALIGAKGRIMPKETLFRKVWGQEIVREDNYVEVYVSFVRKKLAELGASVKISNVRGAGYILKEASQDV